MKYFSLWTPSNEGPVEAVHYRYRIPVYPCPACGNSYPTYHLGYPHLDPASVLEPGELKFIDGKRSPGLADPHLAQRIIRKLEDRWGVPVGPGSFFGPLRIKVSRPVVKYDFQTIVMSFNTFFRRRAAQALQRAGFDFDFVEPEFQGRYAAEADMVQLVVPIVARIRMKTGYVYCERCKVVDGIPEAGATWGLYDGHQIRALPFFLPVESGPLIVSNDFVEAARRVGVRGLIEGDRLKGATLEPVQVISDPVPDHPAIPWPRLRDVAPLSEPSRARGRTKKARLPDVAPSWDRKAAEGWIERLRAFLERVRRLGGETQFACGQSGPLGEKEPVGWQAALRDLLEACGGRLSFRYSLEKGNRTLGGGCRLELGVVEADCKQSAETTWVADDAEQRAIWLKAQPFFALANGDFLALDGASATQDAPVLYLSHEERSEAIGTSLVDFLLAWERLGYVGPEIWILNDFIDGKTGFLSADSPAGQQLRQVLP